MDGTNTGRLLIQLCEFIISTIISDQETLFTLSNDSLLNGVMCNPENKMSVE